MTDTRKVVPSAAPLFLEGTNGKAVLVLHGYTGYPGEFKEMAEKLHQEGYTVSVPRLPGHGTDKKDFFRSRPKDWLHRDIDAYMDLKARYSSVSVVGLSMGGVLTLILASRFRPDRIALLAPAMKFYDPVFYLTPLIRLFVREIPKKNPPTETEPDRKILAEGYWNANYPGQLAKMYKLIRMAKRSLVKITAPALIIVSKGDQAVALEASSLIAGGISSKEKKEIVLEKSGHVLVTGSEKERVFKEVINWLSQEGE